MVSNQTQRVAIVNGFAMSMLRNPERAVVEFRRLSVEEVRQILQNSVVENYVRHPGTVAVLNQIAQGLTPNSGLYTYNGERVILVALTTPPRGQEVATPRLEDLVIYEVIVHTLE
ncbi:MAG: hypothetical protein ACO2PM_20075 [Pyrobaculum sp.]|jgi:hypothetical protein